MRTVHLIVQGDTPALHAYEQCRRLSHLHMPSKRKMHGQPRRPCDLRATLGWQRKALDTHPSRKHAFLPSRRARSALILQEGSDLTRVEAVHFIQGHSAPSTVGDSQPPWHPQAQVQFVSSLRPLYVGFSGDFWGLRDPLVRTWLGPKLTRAGAVEETRHSETVD